MSITTIVFMTVYLIGIVLTLYHPMYGVLMYFFEWHNHPPYWWWGKNLPDPRWSLLIAALTVVSLILNRKKLRVFEDFNYQPLIWLILIVINSYMVSFLFALDPSESLRKSEVLLKLAINYFLMIYIIRNPREYSWIIFIIIACVANFGRVAWEQGSNRDLGVIAPGATSGNLIASYMMTIVPFYATAFLLGNRWMKLFTIIAVPFVLNALILENSRGTILGLFSMAVVAPFLVKGKLRLRLIIGLVFAAIIFLQLTNQQFWERQSTTTHYKEDSGANTRFILWKGAYNFLKDHPFGGGGDSFIMVADQYCPELREKFMEHGNRTVHNTYLNTATDWGYAGLILFLGFLIHSIVLMRRVKRDAKYSPDFNFYNIQAVGLLLAMTGALVAYVFYSRQYAENLYWFSAFGVALRNIQLAEMKKHARETQKVGEEESTEEFDHEAELVPHHRSFPT
ncbi:MAG: hypothetical protein Kow0042_09440 [Calditrichia bacterium]